MLVTLFSLSVPAYADLVTFSSLAAFTAAAPGLPVETFEAGLTQSRHGDTVHRSAEQRSSERLLSGGGGSCRAWFIAQVPIQDLLCWAPCWAGRVSPVLGNTSKVLSPAIVLSSTLSLEFTSATAVGFDVFPGPVSRPIVISVFNPSDVALGTFTIQGAFAGSFFGVLSTTDPIGSLSIDGEIGELIDNLRFGAATVPESSSLLLLAAGLTLVFRLRKRA